MRRMRWMETGLKEAEEAQLADDLLFEHDAVAGGVLGLDEEVAVGVGLADLEELAEGEDGLGTVVAAEVEAGEVVHSDRWRPCRSRRKRD